MLFQDRSRPVRMSQVSDRATEVSYAFSDLVLLRFGPAPREKLGQRQDYSRLSCSAYRCTVATYIYS